MSFYHNVFQKRTASIIKGFLPGLSYVETAPGAQAASAGKTGHADKL